MIHLFDIKMAYQDIHVLHQLLPFPYVGWTHQGRWERASVCVVFMWHFVESLSLHL